MKSVVKDRPEPGIWVTEFPKPSPGRGEVLVRVHRASICGSDLGLYDFSPAFAGFAKLPIIPGHEFAGEVAELGESVSEFRVGERVVAESVLTCGTCAHCTSGHSNLCINFRIFGIHVNGGFSEYVSVPAKHLHHMRDNLSFEQAAIIEPLAVCCHAINDVAKVNPTDTVVVLGPGPIGLLAAQVARAKGCRVLVISGIDVDEKRLAIAANLGFRAVNSSKENLVEVVLKSTGGVGADVVAVAAGSGPALIQACDCVRKGGKILNIAIYPKPVELTVTHLVRREISVLGTFGSVWKNYEEAMDIAANNRVVLTTLVTHSFPIDDARSAFEKAKAKEGCKVQLAI